MTLRSLRRKKRKTALVLSGGGITAAAYEIGCLAALDQRLGSQFANTFFDIYIGVSAGAIIAAMVASQVPAGKLYAAIAEEQQCLLNFKRGDIYRFDGWSFLGACWGAIRDVVTTSYTPGPSWRDLSFSEFLYRLQEQLPSGLFSLTPLRDYLAEIFRCEGIADDFVRLAREFYVPAIDLDRGRRVVFGSEGWRHVAISDAVPASCAVPAFFRPYEINGRHYIDGATAGNTPIDVAIEHGAELVVVVNPLVPFDNDPEQPGSSEPSPKAVTSVSEMGVSCIGEQSSRISSRERFEAALVLCRRAHPDVEIVVFEPSCTDSLMLLRSPMSFQRRRHVMEYAHQVTLETIDARAEWYQDRFDGHGHPRAAAS
ncbi:MAG: patatin-like phospholipase family protein [Deltaproteobacteria bacterium]|nr:patatin-like phospholipase family protein [Deltaproteobacteria bacterium]MBI3387433.1 patatin-like phospholipase family protein [Deltaproteobacteria bacterium]